MKVMMCKYIVLLVLLLSGCTSDTPGPDYDVKGDNAHVELQDSAEHITEPDELRNDVDAVTHQRSQSGILKWILIGIVVLSLSALVYIIVRNVRGKLKEINDKLYKLNKSIKVLEKENRRLVEQIENQEKKIYDDLNIEISRFRRDLDNITASDYQASITSSGTRALDMNREVNNVSEKDRRPIIRKYFKVPDDLGRFEQHKGADNSEGRVYYWIGYQEGSDEAELNYNQGVLVKSTIDQRDSI